MANAVPGLIKQLKVTGPLPRLSPHAERFAAFEMTLDREVELRLAPAESADSPRAKAFKQELDELSALDHPAFLPVLGTGTVAERAYFTVPRREHPTLAELGRDPAFLPAERIKVLASLASTLAHLHGKGLCLGPMDPALIAYDRARGVAWFLHHRMVEDPDTTSRLPFLPPEMVVGGAGTPALDVAWFGALAFGFLSGGKSPYGQGRDEPQPLGPLAPGVPEDWTRLVDRCLARPRAARPADGARLVAQIEAPPPPPAPPAASLPPAAPGPARPAVDTRPSEKFKVAPPAEPPVPRQAPTQKMTAEEARGASSPRLPGPDAGRREPAPPAAPAPGVPPAPAAPGPGGGIPPLALLGLGLLVMAGAYLAAGGGDGSGRGSAGPAGVATPRADPGSAADPTPASTKAAAGPRIDDPYLAILIRQPPVEARDFMRIYAIVAHLARSGRLPGGLNDNESVAAIRARFETEPAGACKDLNELLEKIRTAAKGGAAAP